MTNTVSGPYVKNTYGAGTPFTSTDANNLETQATVALHSYNPDMLGPMVLAGVTPSAAIGSQTLAVQRGVAYLTVSDGTLAHCAVGADSFSTAGNPSATLYLDLNPDGSWSWATTHSAVANAMAIAQVTTDASSNITGVTDKRSLLAPLLPTISSVNNTTGVTAPLDVRATIDTALAGAVTGGVTFGQGGALLDGNDTAAAFDGTSGYISVASPATLATGNGAWSLEAWVYLTANPGTGVCVVGLGTSGTAKSTAQLQINASGFVVLNISGSSVTSAAALSLSAWHHLAGTWDGTTLTLYVDGASTGTPATPGALTLTGAYATIGTYPSTPATVFYGGVADEVAIYGVALASTRVAAHYNAGVSTSADLYMATVLADAPQRYYRLGDPIGATSAACTVAPLTVASIDATGNVTGQSIATYTPAVGNAGNAISLINKTSGDTVYLNADPGGAGLTIWDGAAPGSAVDQLNHAGLKLPGAILSLGGQASAGSLGVPVIVAQTINTHITATGNQTVLSYTPAVAGMYRLNGWFEVHSGTGGVNFLGNWYDPPSGLSASGYFVSNNTTPVAWNNVSVNASGSAQIFSNSPLTFYAGTGASISVTFGGTNDCYVSVILERLS